MSSKLQVVSVVLNNFVNDSRVLKEAITLQNAGYQVLVVAMHESSLEEREVVDDIAVHRVALATRKWSKNFAVQIIKYIEFIYRVVKQYRSAEIFHCNDLNSLPIGVISKLIFNRKAKIVYDAHELETETNGLKGIKKVGVKLMERALIRYADGVVTVGDLIAQEYAKLYKIEKPALVMNTPPYTDVKRHNLFREEFGIREDQKIFIYQGALAHGRGLDIIIDAAKSQKTDEFVVVFMGFGSMVKLVEDAAKENENIYFKPAVPYKEILKYSSSADIGIFYSQDTCLSYRYGLPNKLFEYLMAGIPIIGSKLPEVERLLAEYPVGVPAEVGSLTSLQNAMIEAAKLDLSIVKPNIDAVKKKYNWEVQEEVLLDVYSSLKSQAKV